MTSTAITSPASVKITVTLPAIRATAIFLQHIQLPNVELLSYEVSCEVSAVSNILIAPTPHSFLAYYYFCTSVEFNAKWVWHPHAYFAYASQQKSII